MSLFEL